MKSIQQLDNKFIKFYKKIAKLTNDSIRANKTLNPEETHQTITYSNNQLKNNLPENLENSLNDSLTNYKEFNNEELPISVKQSRTELRGYLLEKIKDQSFETKEEIFNLIDLLSNRVKNLNKALNIKNQYVRLRNYLISEQEPINQSSTQSITTKKRIIKEPKIQVSKNRVKFLANNEELKSYIFKSLKKNQFTISRSIRKKGIRIPNSISKAQKAYLKQNNLQRNKTQFFPKYY